VRLFLAIVPDELRESLSRWMPRDGDLLPGARWQPAENLHVTLRFLGEVADPDVARLGGPVAAAAAAHRRLRLALDGPAALPERKRARVACLGVRPDPRLGALRDAVAAAAESTLGLEPDPRPFRPHLTLAGVKRPWTAAASDAWRALSFPYRGAAFEVTYVDLMESLSSPTGARYRTLERFPLAP
jgi:2'-5' RNA ligase